MLKKRQVDPGIYPGVPFDEYLTWDAVSNTFLKTLMERSPKHAKYNQDHPKEQSKAFLIGSATHCMVLEPSAFAARYVVAPKCDRRTREGKLAYAAFLDGKGDRQDLSQDQYQDAKAIQAAMSGHDVHKYIRDGEAEVCMVWIDPRTGLKCKARADYARREPAALIDLKTTQNATEKSFRRDMDKYRYYQQAAFYSDGWEVLTGNMPFFVFIVAEKPAPNDVAAYEVHDNTILAGQLEYRKALDIYAECLESGEWPGVSSTVTLINISDWALKEAGVNNYQVVEER